MVTGLIKVQLRGASNSTLTSSAPRPTEECDAVHARLEAAPVQSSQQANAEQRPSISVDAQPVQGRLQQGRPPGDTTVAGGPRKFLSLSYVTVQEVDALALVQSFET